MQTRLRKLDEGVVDAMVIISFVGAVVLALGALALLGSLAAAMRSDVAAGDDPWEGHTLEWATATPPPPGNFAEPPAKVVSEAPLLDAEPDDEGGEA